MGTFFVVIADNEYQDNMNETIICSPTTETTCLVSNNLNCQYKWTHQGLKDMVVLSDVLRPLKFIDWRGTYQCTVECQVRGRTCRVNVQTVIANDCTGIIRAVLYLSNNQTILSSSILFDCLI